jgi:Family of unknown function (DUF6252)
MKKFNFFSITLFFSLCLFIACSKDNSDNLAPATGEISYTIDSTKNVKTNLVSCYFDGSSKILNFTIKDGKSIFVINAQMTSKVAVGTYQYQFQILGSNTNAFFREDSTNATSGYITGSPTNLNAIVGKLNITNVSVDSIITGTFDFVLTSPTTNKSIKITKGIVNQVRYKSPVTTNIVLTTNVLSAKIDNTIFNAKVISASEEKTSLTNKYLSIRGLDDKGVRNFSISLPLDAKVGTYDLFTDKAYYVSYSPNSLDILTSFSSDKTNGKIIIKEHNTTTRVLKATFSFDAVDYAKLIANKPYTVAYKVTEGVIEVKY